MYARVEDIQDWGIELVGAIGINFLFVWRIWRLPNRIKLSQKHVFLVAFLPINAFVPDISEASARARKITHKSFDFSHPSLPDENNDVPSTLADFKDSNAVPKLAICGGAIGMGREDFSISVSGMLTPLQRYMACQTNWHVAGFARWQVFSCTFWP
jgi:hypothetical protein